MQIQFVVMSLFAGSFCEQTFTESGLKFSVQRRCHYTKTFKYKLRKSKQSNMTVPTSFINLSISFRLRANLHCNTASNLHLYVDWNAHVLPLYIVASFLFFRIWCTNTSNLRRVFMNYTGEYREIALAHHMIETGDTVRGTAKHFGISKSTVHTEVIN